jgi:hypothetical protein
VYYDVSAAPGGQGAVVFAQHVLVGALIDDIPTSMALHGASFHTQVGA